MAYTNTIAELNNLKAGIKVLINERLAGNYELSIWDTNEIACMAVEMFPDYDSALKYAKRCVEDAHLFVDLR